MYSAWLKTWLKVRTTTDPGYLKELLKADYGELQAEFGYRGAPEVALFLADERAATKRKTKIGLSLSFCVEDIIEGKVNLDEVMFLSVGTAYDSLGSLKNLITDYKRSYWSKNPGFAEEIVLKWESQGMIYQPRLAGNTPLPMHKYGHWVNEEQFLELTIERLKMDMANWKDC